MGLATAKLLASRGAIISLADLNEKALSTALESLPGSSSSSEQRHMAQVIDVRDSSTIDAWIQLTVQRLGKLDGAVNMAGVITPACPVSRMTDADWDFNFAVNARGVFACIRAQVNAMTSSGGSIVSFGFSRWKTKRRGRPATVVGEARTSNEVGRQVCAASVFGQMGSPGVAGYCASKAAVIGLVRTAAKENPHVRMNCVAPGKFNYVPTCHACQIPQSFSIHTTSRQFFFICLFARPPSLFPCVSPTKQAERIDLMC